MNATDILSQEHQVILRVLVALERILDSAVRTGALDGESSRAAIEFFQEFADNCHHAKEEERLFPMLIEHGLPKENGPVAVMLDEHEIGRTLVKTMAHNVNEAAAGDASAHQAFVHASRTVIDMLRDHIGKEDNVLFPMAQGFIGEQGNQILLDEFAKLEAAHEENLHERMLAVADDLCARYGVEAQGAIEMSCGGHGCSGLHGSNHG